MTTSASMIRSLWAIGSKVADPLAEAAFFEEIGGTVEAVDRRPAAGGETIVVFMKLGGLNFHLTNRLRYETGHAPEADDLYGRPGLAHFVLEVTDMMSLADRAMSLGATQVHPRLHLSAAHGEMKAAFLKSPGGLRFQLVERLREADADYARGYSGIPAETVIG